MKKSQLYYLVASLWCMTMVISRDGLCLIPMVYFFIFSYLEDKDGK